MTKASTDQRGFVLVTSLVFLVVITLLAVSAINSSTIQERMASNQREKSRALQAADSTLHVGESIFRDPVFNLQQAPGYYTVKDVTVATSPSDEKLAKIKLWRRDDMLLDKDNASAFLDEAIWNKTQTLAYEVDDAGTQLDPVQYYVEDYKCLRNDLKPGGYCDGSIVYRITARATGENPAAIAVTQSLYEKQY